MVQIMAIPNFEVCGKSLSQLICSRTCSKPQWDVTNQQGNVTNQVWGVANHQGGVDDWRHSFNGWRHPCWRAWVSPGKVLIRASFTPDYFNCGRSKNPLLLMQIYESHQILSIRGFFCESGNFWLE